MDSTTATSVFEISIGKKVEFVSFDSHLRHAPENRILCACSCQVHIFQKSLSVEVKNLSAYLNGLFGGKDGLDTIRDILGRDIWAVSVE